MLRAKEERNSRAMEMSACGRRVKVGLEAEEGVMEERKSGHSSIARERVFRRIGR